MPDTATILTLRDFESTADFNACLALQKATWGDTFEDCVPPHLMMVAQKIGSVAAGAFTADGELVGFVFGMTGVRNGRIVHWSDMLAVRPEARDAGVGRSLKQFQRKRCRQLGVETIYWTYDPLVARNAHLNLNKLGAVVEEYVKDMYANATSPLHKGLAMDRFVVAWDVKTRGTRDAVQAEVPALRPPESHGPVVNAHGELVELTTFSDPVLRVEVPRDIQTLMEQDMASAIRWRESTRRVLPECLRQGYRVAQFQKTPQERCFYVLSRV